VNYRDLQYELTGINDLLNLTEDTIKVLPVKPSRGHIQARLRPSRHLIQINIDEEWNINQDTNLSLYLNKSYHEHPLLEISRDLLYNNVAHQQICPASIELHHKLLDVIAETLKKEGKESYSSYVCHALEDIIVNPWCKLNSGHYKGMVIFFYDQLNQPSRGSLRKSFLGKIFKSTFSSPKFSSFYEIFVRVNLALWGEEDDFSLLKNYFTRKKEVEDAVRRILDIFRLEDSVTLEEKVEVLSNKDWWMEFAREFSLLVVELLNDTPKEQLSCENYFEKEIMNIEMKKRFIKKMYQTSREKPQYIGNIETTRLLYEMLAPEIPIQVDTEKKGRAMPVVPFNYEPFDPSVHSKDDIDLGGVIVDPESPFFKMVNFRVPKYHYDLFVPYRTQRKGAFPDICFLLDTSASMADDVESKISLQTIGMAKRLIKSRFYFGEGRHCWSDKSKYHHVLLGFNGAIKWLQSQGIAPYIRYNVITFSRDTLTSGWREYSELNECKRIAYLPQFDTTLIQYKIIERELLRREPFVLIILSDGEIFNWNENTKAYSPHRLRDLIRGIRPVRSLFKQIVEANMVSHIQISEGDFKPRISKLTCQDLANWGAEIYRINDINSLESLMIKITRKVMSPYL